MHVVELRGDVARMLADTGNRREAISVNGECQLCLGSCEM
jgi:hypothetical protein